MTLVQLRSIIFTVLAGVDIPEDVTTEVYIRERDIRFVEVSFYLRLGTTLHNIQREAFLFDYHHCDLDIKSALAQLERARHGS